MNLIQFFAKFVRARGSNQASCFCFRCFFILFLGVFSGGFIFPQQIIFKVGDNIMDYLGKNPTQYMVFGTFLLNSPDGRVDFLKYKAETTEVDTKYLVQGSTVFGVMQYENNASGILYDINGDGILDVRHDSLFLPFWVLSESTYTKISKNNNLLQFMDYGFKMFNDDAGPAAAVNKFLSDLSANVDISINNRDLFYGMLEYYNFVDDPVLALMLISELGIRCEERFGTVHPLILLHMAESLIDLSDYDLAIDFVNELLSTNPDFVPAKVYSWQLEKNPTVKQRKYNELKASHPNHWIVRGI